MILSHEHKFIYIKTYKTASTSMEAALSEICGPDDIITPTSVRLMKARPTGREQNWRLEHPAVPKRPLWRRLLGRPERPFHPSVGYYEHMPAWRVRAYIGEEIWNSYYKFTFERNPWERQVSWYYYKTKNRKPRPTFEAFLKSHRAYVENFDLYSMNDEIVMDFVGRYENLTEDFETAMAAIGLAGKVTLPRANVSEGKERDYHRYYDDRSKALVASWYRREIDAFGYEF